MDDNILDDFINQTGKVKRSKNTETDDEIKVSNECTIFREKIEANKKILNQNFHGWTSTVDYLITGASKKDKDSKKLEVVKPGVNMEKWEKNIRQQMEGDDLASKMYRTLHPELCEPKEKVENNHEGELIQLQRQKQLRAQHEQMMAKCRTNKKIKAKNYHRHARKRDIKEFLRTDGNKPQTNEIKDRLDRMRAEERISQKHKTNGKFAKLSKLRAKYDENTRDALNEMSNKHQELTRKVNGTSEDEMSEDSEVESEDEDSEMEEMATNECDEVAPVHKSLQNLTKNDTVEHVTKVANVVFSDSKMLLNNDDHLAEDSNEILTSSDMAAQRDAILEIYQQDNELTEEFERQKAELVKKEAPQDIVTYVPGWGDWTGPGLEANDARRKSRMTVKAPAVARTDGKKPRVWIKQSVHDGLKKHLVKTIPYPYNTIEQYELSRQQLVSSAFTMESVSRKLCTPRIKTRPGAPIRPIRYSDKNKEF